MTDAHFFFFYESIKIFSYMPHFKREGERERHRISLNLVKPKGRSFHTLSHEGYIIVDAP